MLALEGVSSEVAMEVRPAMLEARSSARGVDDTGVAAEAAAVGAAAATGDDSTYICGAMLRRLLFDAEDSATMPLESPPPAMLCRCRDAPAGLLIGPSLS